jgi:hypothetical protein
VIQSSSFRVAGGDAEEDRFADPIWMHLSVRQAQRHAPGATEQQPLFDSSQLSELLDVSRQI